MMTKKPSSVKNDAASNKETAKNPSTAVATQPKYNTNLSTNPNEKSKSRITVKYDVGFHNAIYIRGQGGANLNWERGVPLKNISANEWVWDCDANFSTIEFKILINDRVYETGPNHHLKYGSQAQILPKF